MVVALVSASIFATGTGMTTENLKVYNRADILSDDTESYVPTARNLTLTLTDSAGNVIDETSSIVSYDIVNYGNLIKRFVVGDSDPIDIADKFYDIVPISAFADSIEYTDPTFVGDETIDGRSVKVYSIEIGIDPNAFFYGASPSGTLVGYDKSDDDYDGDAVVKVYVDSTTGGLVRAEWTLFFNPGLGISKETYDMVVDYDTVEIDGTEVAVATKVTIDGSYRTATNTSLIYDAASFTLEDELSGYVYLDDFERTW